MNLEHIDTTVEQICECVYRRHEKKVPEAADFEGRPLDSRVNPQPSELVNSVTPGLRKRDGRALDWRICDAI